MSRVFCFPPVANEKSRILILGSMPGAASLKAQQYYAHPRNHFWPVMGALADADPALPYPERLEMLQRSGIALWDVLQGCVRPGSLDSSITEEAPNDFPAFFAAHPRIAHVFFNGQKAAQSFRRHFPSPDPRCWLGSPSPGGRGKGEGPPIIAKSLSFTTLPSTSPANASWSFERKLAAWKKIMAA